MTIQAPRALRLVAPPEPDRDFDALRADAIRVVVEDAGSTWTDHNPSDPGITLLEVLAWGLADLHYRTSVRAFDLAPLQVPLWLAGEDRHWSGLPLLDDPAALVALATTMAAPVPPAGSGLREVDRMSQAIAQADSRRAAIGALTDATFGGHRLKWEEAATVVRLLRAGRMRRALLDRSDRVAWAIDEARRRIVRAAPSAPVDEGSVDTRALALLREELREQGLWDDELRSLLRYRRHRLLIERVATLTPDIEQLTGTGADTIALLAELTTEHGLTANEAVAALALHPCPPGQRPERWEAAGGATRTWPPHPLQARTCEPVTGPDYARRARAAPKVRRAWTVPALLPGIAWDGTARTAREDRPGAVTLLVEAVPEPTAGQRQAFLRAVLVAVTRGPGEQAEVDDPFETLRASSLQTPRRMICDELGAALMRRCPVTLKGALHVLVGTDREAIIAAALARTAAYFVGGRAESAAPGDAPLTCPDDIEGPWPAIPQPPGGWNPGEAIRVSELVQVLSDDPNVLGVEGVAASVDGGAWIPSSAGGTSIPLDSDCVPVLAERQCLQVRLELAADCGRG